ncbi:MAG: hydantoinase/carbamoylase family amidase [Rhizobiales bacterium]|nr:hydantoinase/carbamoylase family amidase [Hyphomicrobiales bacterium]
MALKINEERLLSRLGAVSRIGKYKTGIHRPTYSPADMEARRWLVEQLGSFGHEAFIDGIGNVVGLGPSAPRRLLAGSHIESQNHAGRLDGVLGVLYGLELAQTLAETYGAGGPAVDVMAFADEEGHFHDYLGVRSALDDMTDAERAAVVNIDTGEPLQAALEKAGLAGLPRYRIDPSRYAGYIEAHIEQGDYLDSGGLRLGYVLGIVGVWQYNIVFSGQQNHAGTTRMVTRKDAAMALMKFGAELDRVMGEAAGPRSVWTPGRIVTMPGAPNVIPERAEMLFQFRDLETSRLEAMERALLELAGRHDALGPCSIVVENMSKAPPVPMAPAIVDSFERAGERLAPGAGMRMPSAAGHDAQYVARVMPAGMLFVPSIGGISHHWSEDTRDEDIVLGFRVYAEAADAILAG